MIRDRGNIKWTAMMLPEHVAKLRKWVAQDHHTERPDLNEWDLQLIQEELDLAYQRQCETLINIWVSGNISVHQGVVENIDLRNMCIVVRNSLGAQTIAVATIVNVQSME